jgi:hypothetical protein
MEPRKRAGSNQPHRDSRSLWSKTWRNRQGKVVIWQTPNLPLIAWAGLTFFSLMVNGRLADILSWLGSAGLIIWSLLEIFKGVNYFRRALGLLVLFMAIMSLLKSL